MPLSLQIRIPTALLIAASCLLPPAPSHAQAVTGAGADAITLPKGSVKIRLGGVWDGYNAWQSDQGRTPYLAGLSTSALGIQRLPQLAPIQAAINSLAGIGSTFQLSLGSFEATGDTRSTTTPFALDVGITRRLSIGIVVPYVESRDNALLILNRDGTTATVGQNPAFNATSGTAARNTNGTLLRQLAQARSQLLAEITRCATPTETGCDAIRANVAGANSLATQSATVESLIGVVYGDSVRGGSPVVPIIGSTTQTAIQTRIGSLRTSFEGFGITELLAGLFPTPATTINGPGSVSAIAKDSAYGLNYTTLGGTRRAGIGDIDLTASFQWLNTLGARPAQWLTATSFGVRSLVTGGWRFGTAGADRTEDAFDVPIGNGANALLVRSTTDVLVNKWFWMSGTLRVVQPLTDHVVIRRPLFVDSALFVPSATASAERTLGRRVEIELAPRISVGRFIGFSGGYVMRRSDADTYAFGATDTLSATTMSTPSRTAHAYMLGATFSTMASYIQGRAKWPVEVLYVHTAPIRGGGGLSPAMTTDRLELRVYTGYPRR